MSWFVRLLVLAVMVSATFAPLPWQNPVAGSAGTGAARSGEPRQAASSPGIAQVRYIYHGLGVQPPHRNMEQGKVKMPLFEQYFLRTGASEKASIGFDDGTTLHLNADTDAVLSSPHLTAVKRGQVAEYLAPGTSHRVETASAVAAAIGTTFLISQTGQQSTFVVLHGALQVANRFGSVVVKSNHQTVALLNRPPEPPQPADARAAFAWTQGIPTPDLGEDVTLDANGGTIVGYSSQYQGAGDRWHVEHVNDGLLSEGWETANGKVKNQWVKFGFQGGNFYRISDVIIDPAATHGDPPGADLKDFEVRVSSTGPDDASFTTVLRGTCRQEDSLQRFTLSVPVRARYIELVASDNYGDPMRLAVAEFEAVATTSLFAQPFGIAVDRLGNVYVADTNSDRIEKLSPKGVTLARWGKKGNATGEFLQLKALAVDRSGTIYVADTGNDRIEKLSPRGRVLAVWGTHGVGPGQFSSPEGIAVDMQGDVYVADSGNNRVQKLSPEGNVLTVWTLVGTAGFLSFPEGVAVDSHGKVYVADTGNDRIVILNPDETLARVIGTQGTQPGQFQNPSGIAVDRQGTIYVADTFNSRVQKLSPSGTVRAVFGKLGYGRGQFILVGSVSLDDRGSVYATDLGNARIQKFSPAGKVQAVWGKFATVPQVLGQPGGLAVDAQGRVYVTDDVNDRVQRRSSSGSVMDVWGYHGFVGRSLRKGLGQFWWPHGISVDKQGAMYIADTSNSRIQVLSQRGPIAAYGQKGTKPGQFLLPWAVALDRAGNMYVADSGNNRIQKLSPGGKVLAMWGTAGTAQGQFFSPTGIALDRAGNMYVADQLNSRIQKLSPTGQVLAVWGAPSYDARGQFFLPEAVAVGRDGTIYVADTGHHAVQLLSPAGQTVANWTLPGQSPSPSSLSLDTRGNVYVGDEHNGWVVKFSPQGKVLAVWS